jgi:hypothetical protein
MTKYVFFFEIAKLLLIEKRVQAQAVLREKKRHRIQGKEGAVAGYNSHTINKPLHQSKQ